MKFSTLNLIVNLKKIKNNTGSLLLSLSLLTALAGFTGTSLYSMIQSMDEDQVTKNKITQYQLLTLSLRSLISRPDICTSALQNQTFDPSPNSKQNVIVDSSIFEEKQFIGNIKDISNSKFTLINKGFKSDKILSDSEDPLHTYKTNLQVWLPKNNKESFNYENLNISIPLYININKDDNTINNCYGVYSKAAICEKNWKSWNQAESDLDKQCNPDRQCILYASNSCSEPSIKIAIGNIKTIRNNPGVSMLSGYKYASRSFDSMNALYKQALRILDAYEKTLKNLKKTVEETKKNVDATKKLLDEARKELNQNIEELRACTRTCSRWVTDWRGNRYLQDYSCNCSLYRYYLVSIPPLRTRVAQLEEELRTIEEQYQYMTDMLELSKQLKGLNEYTMTRLNLQITLAQAGLRLTNPKILIQHTQYKKKLRDQIIKGFEDTEKARSKVSKKYLNNADPDGMSINIKKPKKETVLNLGENARKEALKLGVSYNTNNRYNMYTPRSWDETIKTKKLNPHLAFRTVGQKSDYVSGTNNVVNAVYDIETKMNAINKKNNPPVKRTLYGSDSPPVWRKGANDFKDLVNRFQSQNQLLHNLYMRGGMGYRMIQTFTPSPTTAIQQETIYMCMWCNKNRIKKINSNPSNSLF